jgi:SAM-dependent methyltransferase
MRKDYIATVGPSDHETQFVEDYWTQVWEREGGPKGAIERIPEKDEYRIMAPHLSKLPKGARILDGGCGLGDWVLALSRMGYDVVGMDLSRRTVEQLQGRFPDASFIAGDIRSSGFAGDSFEAYFSWGVFEHFESGPQDCLREAWRILKPGGMLFISVPLDNLRHSLLGSLGKPKPADAGSSRFYQYRFTRGELAKEIDMAGFDLVSIHPIHKRQGVLRSLHHEFGMRFDWFVTKGFATVIAPLIPGWAIAHMVLAVARKRE